MMVHNLGIRKNLHPLFHRDLYACPRKFSAWAGGTVFAFLQTFRWRWFIMSREYLGALSFSVLRSCSQEKGQSFLAPSPVGNPWCAFGKILLPHRELEQAGKALCKSHWRKLSTAFVGSPKNSFSATLLSPLYPLWGGWGVVCLYQAKQCSHCKNYSLVHHRMTEYLWVLMCITSCHWGFSMKTDKLGQI